MQNVPHNVQITAESESEEMLHHLQEGKVLRSAFIRPWG